MSLNISQIKQFENLELLAKELVEGFITGLHRSPYHGFSVEFAEHKLYNFGESTKNIDWKVFARTDRLYTKQYEEETNLRCNIVLDVSPSMFFPEKTHEKLKFSIYCAAALSYLMVRQRDAVGITSFSDEILFQSQVKSTKVHLNSLLIELDRLLKLDGPPPASNSNISETLHEIANKIHKRSLVIIFTDLMQQGESLKEVFEALQHLKHKKNEILLFHVKEGDLEADFNFEERPYKFVDIESGKQINLSPNQVREEYKKRIDSFYEEIKMGCGRLKIDFIEVNTHSTFDKILSSYLIKRQKMK